MRIVVTGGVAANNALRKRVAKTADPHGFKYFFPKSVFCTDNAAMIACAGYYKSLNKPLSLKDTLNFDAKASLKL